MSYLPVNPVYRSPCVRRFARITGRRRRGTTWSRLFGMVPSFAYRTAVAGPIPPAQVPSTAPARRNRLSSIRPSPDQVCRPSSPAPARKREPPWLRDESELETVGYNIFEHLLPLISDLPANPVWLRCRNKPSRPIPAPGNLEILKAVSDLDQQLQVHVRGVGSAPRHEANEHAARAAAAGLIEATSNLEPYCAIRGSAAPTRVTNRASFKNRRIAPIIAMTPSGSIISHWPRIDILAQAQNRTFTTDVNVVSAGVVSINSSRSNSRHRPALVLPRTWSNLSRR